jgi:DNA-binding response OmpR family regulator
MRRMLLALVQARLEEPGRALTRDELLAAGWPDERILPRAARRRLEVMVSRMRELGLQGALQTVHGGYRLAPDLQIVTRDEPRDAT